MALNVRCNGENGLSLLPEVCYYYLEWFVWSFARRWLGPIKLRSNMADAVSELLSR